jgi:hypothetical protein
LKINGFICILADGENNRDEGLFISIIKILGDEEWLKKRTIIKNRA